MAKWMPCKRKDFIKKLRKLGFGPLKMLLTEIEHGINKKISLEQWGNL